MINNDNIQKSEDDEIKIDVSNSDLKIHKLNQNNNSLDTTSVTSRNNAKQDLL